MTEQDEEATAADQPEAQPDRTGGTSVTGEEAAQGEEADLSDMQAVQLEDSEPTEQDR